MSYFRQYRPARHSQLPPAVLNLIIINGIFFLAKLFGESRGMEMDVLLGLHHPFAHDFHWYQYITSLFMHADLGHIGYNMFGLWMFGHLLENAFGTKRFLIFYMICGIGAALIFQGWESYLRVHQVHHDLPFIQLSALEILRAYPPQGPLIGASGAVFGLLMGAALLFPNTEMRYMGPMGIPIKIKWLAIIFGVGELYLGWRNQGDSIAHFAHIGGMIFGFILVKIYSRSRTNFY